MDYREAHLLPEEIADASLDGARKDHMDLLSTVPLLLIDDLGIRKLPPTAAEELMEIVMRRHPARRDQHPAHLQPSGPAKRDSGKLLGDSAAVIAMVGRLLHHGHVLKCDPPSWRTKTSLSDHERTG